MKWSICFNYIMLSMMHGSGIWRLTFRLLVYFEPFCFVLNLMQTSLSYLALPLGLFGTNFVMCVQINYPFDLVYSDYHAFGISLLFALYTKLLSTERML